MEEHTQMLNNHQENIPQAMTLMIFGGTGDLMQRKLLPALYHLIADGKLPAKCTILSIGRKAKDDQGYREEARQAIQSFSRTPIDDQHMARFLSHLHYRQMEFVQEPESYAGLRHWLEELEQGYDAKAVRLFFLAVAPEFFGTIVQRLHKNGLVQKGNLDHRVMVEKPFGSDLATAEALNETISEALDEHQVYRIDHYLGKEMIRNILAIRFGNSLFEPLWNHHYIDNIQISSTETLGVENRGSYYEQSGILKDMLQNHLLQMLALITMEPPVDLAPESVRDEKVKALRSLRLFQQENGCEEIVLGQYGQGERGGKTLPAYRDEEKVAPDSVIPTYVAVKTGLDNFRWGGVPIYIRAGKRLSRSLTQIVIEFKRLPGINYYQDFDGLPPNLLVIEVQPAEGMYFQINLKRPGNEFRMERVEMNYSQSAHFQGNVPEAYEQLLLEACRQNSSLFARWDELRYSWRFVESIEGNCTALQTLRFPNYAAGSRGPEAADQLLKADGRAWWEIELPCEGPHCAVTQ